MQVLGQERLAVKILGNKEGETFSQIHVMLLEFFGLRVFFKIKIK